MTFEPTQPKRLRRRLKVACMLAALALSAPAASVLAGAKTTENVSITNTSLTRVAEGSLGSVRASSNRVDYIGCWGKEVYGTTNVVTGGCEARQSTLLGTRSISCEFPVAANGVFPAGYLWSLSALTPDAHIRFTWDSVNGKNICRTLIVKNFSHSRPKTP